MADQKSILSLFLKSRILKRIGEEVDLECLSVLKQGNAGLCVTNWVSQNYFLQHVIGCYGLDWNRPLIDTPCALWWLQCRSQYVNLTCLCFSGTNKTMNRLKSKWPSRSRKQMSCSMLIPILRTIMRSGIVTFHSISWQFIQAISIAPLQVHYYSAALPTQHGYCVGASRRSAAGNCEWRTCPRSLRGV